jgi:hypothetical protein
VSVDSEMPAAIQGHKLCSHVSRNESVLHDLREAFRNSDCVCFFVCVSVCVFFKAAMRDNEREIYCSSVNDTQSLHSVVLQRRQRNVPIGANGRGGARKEVKRERNPYFVNALLSPDEQEADDERA